MEATGRRSGIVAIVSKDFPLFSQPPCRKFSHHTVNHCIVYLNLSQSTWDTNPLRKSGFFVAYFSMSHGYGAILKLGVSRQPKSSFQDIICHLDQDSPHCVPQPTTNVSTAIRCCSLWPKCKGIL